MGYEKDQFYKLRGWEEDEEGNKKPPISGWEKDFDMEHYSFDIETVIVDKASGKMEPFCIVIQRLKTKEFKVS